MARPRKNTVRIPVSASLLPEIDDDIVAIHIKEGRTKSQVIEMLLRRGLAAYHRDSSLLELAGKKVVRIADIGIEDTQNQRLSRSAASKAKK